jgi:hypothetical protein
MITTMPESNRIVQCPQGSRASSQLKNPPPMEYHNCIVLMRRRAKRVSIFLSAYRRRYGGRTLAVNFAAPLMIRRTGLRRQHWSAAVSVAAAHAEGAQASGAGGTTTTTAGTSTAAAHAVQAFCAAAWRLKIPACKLVNRKKLKHTAKNTIPFIISLLSGYCPSVNLSNTIRFVISISPVNFNHLTLVIIKHLLSKTASQTSFNARKKSGRGRVSMFFSAMTFHPMIGMRISHSSLFTMALVR